MQLDDAEKRVLQAALREFAAAAESDFPTLRECHSFLSESDDQVNVQALAKKLEVTDSKE